MHVYTVQTKKTTHDDALCFFYKTHSDHKISRSVGEKLTSAEKKPGSWPARLAEGYRELARGRRPRPRPHVPNSLPTILTHPGQKRSLVQPSAERTRMGAHTYMYSARSSHANTPKAAIARATTVHLLIERRSPSRARSWIIDKLGISILTISLSC